MKTSVYSSTVWGWTLVSISIISAASDNICKGRETCSQCIRAHPRCAWCLEPKEKGEHCDLFEAMKTCEHYFHVTNNRTTTKNRALNSDAELEENVVQVKPQEVLLELKPNDPYELWIQYKQAENYPVDLYYLMDLSYSMKDDKEKLVNLGDKLAREMKTITKKFQLGFGAFVEKVTLPFVNIIPNQKIDYAFPYGFRNYLPLSRNTGRFKTEVQNSQISGNYDAPEGGLDALVQAVSCKDKIKWGENSTKLLVFSTDAGYHFAGDGKLAGIVKPNDGNCHLDDRGNYTESLTQDYPSVSQIRNLLRDNKINVIFAVTRDQNDVYEDLARELESATVGVLEDDSSNVVQLIRDQYDKIRSSVKIRDDSADPIKITYFSSCLGKTKKQTDSCENIPVGGSVTFVARIELTSCPENARDWNRVFEIFPTHLNEAVKVKVRMICECQCEEHDKEERKSPKCSGNGTFECGICNCDPGRYGEKCECSGDGTEGYDQMDTTRCFGGNDTVVCSGRGKCFCGKCQCEMRTDPEEKVSGKYCECDNFSCDRRDNLLCGGPDRGKCECGRCVCMPGWKGDVCDCRDSVDTCLDPVTKKVCNDRGDCTCGSCKCKESKTERYDGAYCQQCLICPGSCQAYGPCVQCKIFASGPLEENECANCTGIYRELKDGEDVSSSHECAFDDEIGCRYFFFYELQNDSPVVKVKKRKECPKPVNALAIGLGVAGAIAGLGLAALLIWKLITTVHDSREYAKFLKEIQDKKWNEEKNPLYKEATSTFHNPAFGDAT
ncbi:integrin beta-PS-like [Centruroides sculpturatus]|uniref:integrin beta-PS-like n=1 Tax=Centruroides sculpturatus TaxID=218467 RepID=UPI000C6E6BCA|nr:integrin beta-PS-like [Centruroides sculpturatus]XP_023220340.1 integrin beta-PS-like [Centruroides sculpturatus]